MPPLDTTNDLWQMILPWLMYAAIGVLISLLISIIIWWSIFSKAGYSGARSLLLFIPVVNIIIFLIFAFGEWPIHRQMDEMQQELNALHHQVTVLQYSQRAGSHPGFPVANQGYQSNPHQQYPFNH